jgi:4-amino-4-deoxy-L-arabinose transferase-like glycosyltransferase
MFCSNVKMKFTRGDLWIHAGIAILAALLFIPLLGAVPLFDWDELNFAESAREMIVSGNYLTVQINFEPFWEKPPLFFWMQALSMKLFGINEFAARFPNAICGIITLLVIYNIGKTLKGKKFGLIWTFAYVASFLPFFYFKSGIIDPWFNLFIFLGIYFFVLYTAPGNRPNGLFLAGLSAFFIGLATLTKGPAAILIFILCFIVYLLVVRFGFRWQWQHILAFAVVLAFVGGFWFILQILDGNYRIIEDFIVYQIRLFKTEDAGHGGFPLYHFAVLLAGVFPASLFALPAFKRSVLKHEHDAGAAHFFRWQMILFWVVLILFSIVKTKIVHYSSLCYFPLTFLAAWHINRVTGHRVILKKIIPALLSVFAFVFAVPVGILPFTDRLKESLLPLFDEFTRGNMEATASWFGFEPLIPVVLLSAVVLFWIYAYRRRDIQKAFVCLACGSLVFTASVIYIYPFRVEKYSQGATIEFYKSKAGEDCYLQPQFKSYAHYFYGNVQPQPKHNADFYLTGPIDKTVYFVVRKTERNMKHFEEAAPEAELLYTKNGFAFFERTPNLNNQ